MSTAHSEAGWFRTLSPGICAPPSVDARGVARVERLERWELGREVGGAELEALLGAAEVFQTVGAQVAQRHLRRQLIAHQLGGRQ